MNGKRKPMTSSQRTLLRNMLKPSTPKSFFRKNPGMLLQRARACFSFVSSVSVQRCELGEVACTPPATLQASSTTPKNVDLHAHLKVSFSPASSRADPE